MIAANDNAAVIFLSPPPTRNRMIIFIAAIVALIASTLPANAINCKSSPSAETKTWRLVAGKRCWYAGPARIDKKKLHWRVAKVARQRPALSSTASVPLPTARPANLGFEDRWKAIYK